MICSNWLSAQSHDKSELNLRGIAAEDANAVACQAVAFSSRFGALPGGGGGNTEQPTEFCNRTVVAFANSFEAHPNRKGNLAKTCAVAVFHDDVLIELPNRAQCLSYYAVVHIVFRCWKAGQRALNVHVVVSATVVRKELVRKVQ